MENAINNISLGKAALITGLALLTMVITAPFAEVFVYPKLVIPGNAAATILNIRSNQALFILAIFAYLVTFICDTIAAWLLYILLTPVNERLSRITAWFRFVFAGIAVISLLNLVTVFRLLNTSDFLNGFGQNQLQAQVMLSLIAFRSGFHFAILFFAIHLGLLGFLILKSAYIPKILGMLLIISGLGYLSTTLQPFLFPTINLSFATYTFYGELIFMLWLLIRGSKIKVST